MRVFEVIRDITEDECPWFRDLFELRDVDLFKYGEIVFEYTGFTYGCITPTGIAVRRSPMKDQFIEVPKNALNEIGCFKKLGDC